MIYKLPYDIDKLYSNCLYVYCVHLACIPRREDISKNLVWKGSSFGYMNYDNADGIITFDLTRNLIYGGFCKKTNRWNEYPDKKAIEYFDQASNEIKDLVNVNLLNYFLTDIVVQKKSLFKKEVIVNVPVLTTSFWSSGNVLYSKDPIDTFMLQGGKFIQDIYLDKDKLIDWLKNKYEVKDNELSFADELYKLKLQGSNYINKELLLLLGEKIYECNTLIKILENSGMIIEK